jgi:hypothetical protein
MKKLLLSALFIGAVLLMASAIGSAQENTSGKIFGKAYFSYFHDFSSGREVGSGQINRFEFTRLYFGYDRDLNEDFSIRFLMDAGFDTDYSLKSSSSTSSDTLYDSNGDTVIVPLTSTSYTLQKTSSNFRPFVKNAYLSMKCKLIEGSRWYFGMVGMPFVGVPENMWGYRSLHQLAMDKQGWGSTADLGALWKGTWQDMFQIELAVANGAGYKSPDADMFKLFELRPAVFLLDKALTLSAFGSYETLNDSSSTIIFEGTAGYDHPWFRIGGEFAMRTIADGYWNSADSTTQDLTGNIISLWGHFKAHEKLTLLARYDMYEPNSDLDDDEATLLIAGLDFHPAKNVRIMPNVQIYSNAADNPATPSVNEDESENRAFLTFEYGW